MSDNSMTMKKCPVCGESYFVKSLELHITKMAGREAMRAMVAMVNKDDKGTHTFKASNVLSVSPHWKYRREHRKPYKPNPLEL